MLRVRINREYKTLVRYCENNRGSEWVCVRGIFQEYNAYVWEIWQRPVNMYKKRHKWVKVTYCGSWANMADRWEFLTGQIVTYAHS